MNDNENTQKTKNTFYPNTLVKKYKLLKFRSKNQIFDQERKFWSKCAKIFIFVEILNFFWQNFYFFVEIFNFFWQIFNFLLKFLPCFLTKNFFFLKFYIFIFWIYIYYFYNFFLTLLKFFDKNFNFFWNF